MPARCERPTGRLLMCRAAASSWPRYEQIVPRGDLEGLTPKIAKLYAGAGPQVLSRDLNRLEILTSSADGAADTG
jgi:hypothetical protein